MKLNNGLLGLAVIILGDLTEYGVGSRVSRRRCFGEENLRRNV